MCLHLYLGVMILNFFGKLHFNTINDVGNVGVQADDGQKRILKTPLVEKHGFIKAQGQDPWTERAESGQGKCKSLGGILEARFPGL